MSIAYTYSVKQLSRQLKQLLESDFGDIAVSGEITQLTRAASGHIYFSLKEDNHVIRCAFFKNRHSAMQTRPEEGRKVVIQGRVSLYEPRGDLQFIVSSMQDEGIGDLSVQFEQLKQKLRAEGLFENTYKKTIPSQPERIGVITSATGSVIRDILTTLSRRYPLAKVTVYPSSVQGQNAVSEIIEMLAVANTRRETDVLILARGGGSLEDLQAFNDEAVARAIFSSELPVISAVGHETDFTIADMVADLRAPTPTAAAEICSADMRQIAQQLSKHQRSLGQALRRYIETKQQYIDLQTSRLRDPVARLNSLQDKSSHLQTRLIKDMLNLLSANRQQIKHQVRHLLHYTPARQLQQQNAVTASLHQSLIRSTSTQLKSQQLRLESLTEKLSILGPEQTLKRGYSILLNDDRQVISTVSQAKQAKQLTARLSDGDIRLTSDDNEII